MNIIARNYCVRSSAQKLRLIIDVIRYKNVCKALDYLNFINKKSAFIIKKILISAIYNAKNNYKLNIDNLSILNILIDKGPSFKRLMPRAKGRVNYITKRTSHITIVITNLVK